MVSLMELKKHIERTLGNNQGNLKTIPNLVSNIVSILIC